MENNQKKELNIIDEIEAVVSDFVGIGYSKDDFIFGFVKCDQNEENGNVVSKVKMSVDDIKPLIISIINTTVEYNEEYNIDLLGILNNLEQDKE